MMKATPDELLKIITNRESGSSEGRLKIFLGMVAGVGKTYSMLTNAHDLKKNGIDVVVGYIETHGRKETEALLAGLEIVPRKGILYKEKTFYEMDTDAIIKRAPHLVLVDEIAHTNIPGSRHLKRYQDVEEILASGISVYSTLNIQHIESLADTVREITNIEIREKIPDSIIDRSNEIVLIDLAPGQVIDRLNAGKIYSPEKIQQSLGNFFSKGNLTALRELSLRLLA
ncbi:MAG: sensor histidine kinase KdpD, partial [Oligoflexia bacterium]|nr:sensor histidine kinase KdpD [Oligoflexia bacterium]